ncbi:MAG TPA: allantoinase AllB [Polyangiales bacterium]
MDAKGIRSTRIVTPEGIRAGTLLFASGRIAEVARYELQAAGIADVGELMISPGLVDCHVHINEPGRTEWEGFATATEAAAAGGVTTLVDMPLNCIPVTTSADALSQKLKACRGQLHVDVGFWGGVVPGNVDALDGLAEAGALGCKAFMVHSGIDEFPNATEADLRRAMPVLKRLGLPLLAHAELDLGAQPFGATTQYANYLASRPCSWEDEAIRLLVRLCEETGCAVHIVHLSSASAVPIVRAAKQRGLPISAETCPHYLCLHAEAIPDGATHYKCAPPIRGKQNQDTLWQALFDGVIDFVITDHSPCTPALKLPERGDFQAAWGGISSLSLGLSSIWTEASQRGATACDLARWMSEVPARFAGLGGRKGRIEPGYDADLVVWDPEESFVVGVGDLHFRHKLSPYVGRTLRGSVHATLLGGSTVQRDGAVLSDTRGKLLLGRERAAAAPL